MNTYRSCSDVEQTAAWYIHISWAESIKKQWLLICAGSDSQTLHQDGEQQFAAAVVPAANT